jgi:hypothetical protein
MSNTAKIKQLTAIPPEDWLKEAKRRERAGDKQGAKTARQFARFLMGQADAFTNPTPRNNPVRQRKGWKIQTESGNGWSDIKSSYGTDFYKTEYFKTKPDAQSELNQLADIHGDPESYRIVPAATEEDFDLYNPVRRKNPVRQRIAVSLSRSQTRKNPLLESGATISRNSGINRRAASMT